MDTRMAGHDLALEGDTDDDERICADRLSRGHSSEPVRVLEARARDHLHTMACRMPWPNSIHAAAESSKRAG
jgi:hypothetical protein